MKKASQSQGEGKRAFVKKLLLYDENLKQFISWKIIIRLISFQADNPSTHMKYMFLLSSLVPI